jgi:hypothetical protein
MVATASLPFALEIVLPTIEYFQRLREANRYGFRPPSVPSSRTRHAPGRLGVTVPLWHERETDRNHDRQLLARFFMEDDTLKSIFMCGLPARWISRWVADR